MLVKNGLKCSSCHAGRKGLCSNHAPLSVPPSPTCPPSASLSDPLSDSSPSLSSPILDIAAFVRPYRFVQKIPQGSRCLAANKLASIIEDVYVKNSLKSWTCLLQFPVHCLRLPESVESVDQKLTVAVNGQVRAEKAPAIPSPSPQSCPYSDYSTPLSSDRLASKVSQKLEVGDFRGAVRLTSSSDSFAEPNDSTLE